MKSTKVLSIIFTAIIMHGTTNAMRQLQVVDYGLENLLPRFVIENGFKSDNYSSSSDYDSSSSNYKEQKNTPNIMQNIKVIPINKPFYIYKSINENKHSNYNNEIDIEKKTIKKYINKYTNIDLKEKTNDITTCNTPINNMEKYNSLLNRVNGVFFEFNNILEKESIPVDKKIMKALNYHNELLNTENRKNKGNIRQKEINNLCDFVRVLNSEINKSIKYQNNMYKKFKKNKCMLQKKRNNSHNIFIENNNNCNKILKIDNNINVIENNTSKDNLIEKQ